LKVLAGKKKKKPINFFELEFKFFICYQLTFDANNSLAIIAEKKITKTRAQA
jgi:hypothetical protein